MPKKLAKQIAKKTNQQKRVNDKLTPRARPVGLEIGAHFVIFTVYKSKIPPEMEVAPR